MSVLYKGTRSLQDTKTGEIIEVDFLLKDIKNSRSDFEITYLNNLFNLFDTLGGKKYAVIKYLIENRNNINQLEITIRELAKKINVNKETVVETLALLRKANIINTKTGLIMINPKLINKGSATNERYLLQKFTSF